MKSTNDELALRHGGRALGLAVRPDVLTTRFAARVAEVDPDRAVLVLKAACEILLRRMKELHHSTTLRMTGLDIGRDVGSKSRDDLSTRVDAELDIALAPDMDWWNRAQLSAAVTVLGRTLEDTPFYARSELETSLGGRRMAAVHESLSLERFSSPLVQTMLPFRIRRGG